MHKQKLPVGIGALSLTLALTTAAQAQAVPDAGSVIQQIQRDTPAPIAPEAPHKLLIPEDAPKAQPGGAKVLVKGFRFKGATVLSDAQLQLIVAPWVGKEQDLAELQAAAAAVGERYRQAGWVVRVALPRQAVEEGLVVIEVIEAHLGQVVLDDKALTRVPAELVRRMVQGDITSGALLNTKDLQRGVMLSSELPGVIVNSALREGAQPGQTDVVVTAQDGARYFANVTADNAGSVATGAYRLIGNLALLSPLKLGDQLSATVVHSEGSDYLRGAYSLPLGPSGLRFGLNGSYLRYHLVNDAFSALHAKGSSSSGAAELTYPLIRTNQASLTAGLSHEYKSYSNNANGALTSEYHSNTDSIRLGGSLFDSWMGGAPAPSTWRWGQSI